MLGWQIYKEEPIASSLTSLFLVIPKLRSRGLTVDLGWKPTGVDPFVGAGQVSPQCQTIVSLTARQRCRQGGWQRGEALRRGEKLCLFEPKR